MIYTKFSRLPYGYRHLRLKMHINTNIFNNALFAILIMHYSAL